MFLDASSQGPDPAILNKLHTFCPVNAPAREALHNIQAPSTAPVSTPPAAFAIREPRVPKIELGVRISPSLTPSNP